MASRQTNLTKKKPEIHKGNHGIKKMYYRTKCTYKKKRRVASMVFTNRELKQKATSLYAKKKRKKGRRERHNNNAKQDQSREVLRVSACPTLV